MKVAILPGSFNPWHRAHAHILEKACLIFDKVYVARGVNGNKPPADRPMPETDITMVGKAGQVKVIEFTSTLAHLARELKADAIVRGLRNVFDFYEEKDNQYWHEDLGLTCPIFYVISDRSLCHVSSKAVRIVETFKK